MSKFLTSKLYSSLPQPEPVWLSSFGPENEAARRRHLRRVRRILNLWAGTAVFFAVLSAWLGAQLYRERNGGSFARGLKHELKSAKHLIELEERMFGGSPHFLDDGTEYVPEPDDGIPRPQYVGEPSRTIDHEWALLHWGRFFLLSEEEAREAWGPGYKEFYAPKHGGYVAALEVMHTVHCLDHLRKAYYPDIYPPDSPIHGIKHRDHCINHLRQVILCNGDLTPIPSRFYIGIDQNYIDSDRPHTCRNWEKIRNWVSERYNGSLAVPPDEGVIVGDEFNKLNGVNG